MTRPNDMPLLPDEPLVKIVPPRTTPQSIASGIGAWVLGGIQVIAYFILAAAALTGAMLAIQALMFVYRLATAALGVDGHG